MRKQQWENCSICSRLDVLQRLLSYYQAHVTVDHAAVNSFYLTQKFGVPKITYRQIITIIIIIDNQQWELNGKTMGSKATII
jgi:hypothetical protein